MKYEITTQTPSQELFQDILRTIPVVPIHSEISMVVEGNGNVIPDARIALYFVPRRENPMVSPPRFHNWDEIILYIEKRSGEGLDEAVLRMINEGRIGKVEIVTGATQDGVIFPDKDGFERFRAQGGLFNTLTQKGYSLHGGNAWFGYWTHYHSDDVSPSGYLSLGRRVHLGVPAEAPLEGKWKELMAWFHGLEEKYEVILDDAGKAQLRGRKMVKEIISPESPE